MAYLRLTPDTPCRLVSDVHYNTLLYFGSSPPSFACSDGYSSGYSDGGGGQDKRDNMVCDLADSDEGDNNMVCDIADAESDDDVGAGVDVDIGGSSAASPRSWHQEGSASANASASAPMGLEVALAKAKAATGDSSRVASIGPPEDVIDLLSGDEGEGQGRGVVDVSSPPPRSPSVVEPIKAMSELDGVANDEPVEISDLPVNAEGESPGPGKG